ncbi:MAG: sensor histidine kinase [Anaeromyxobacter sp.]
MEQPEGSASPNPAATVPASARFRRSLFTEVLAGAGLLLAAVAALGWFITRGALERQAWQRGREAAAHLTGELDRELDAVVRLGETLEAWWRAGDLDVDAPGQLERLVLPLLARQGFVSSVNFCRADGTSVLLLRTGDAWSRRVIREGPEGHVAAWRRREGLREIDEPWAPTTYDPRTRDWYTRVADTGGPRWSPEAYRFMTTQDPGITFSIPVHDGGTLAGVIALDVMLDDLTGRAWSAQPTPRTRVTIGDASGRALILPRLPEYLSREARFRDFLAPLGPTLSRELAALPGGLAAVDGPVEVASTTAGEPFYVLARPYQGPAGLDWRLAVAIPEADIQRGARARGAGVAALAALGLALLAWRARAIAERFGRPLDRLAAAPVPAAASSAAGTARPPPDAARLTDLFLEEHEALQARLRDGQRRETVGTLASGVAHDVNNQLTIVLAQLSLALDELPPGHPLAPELEMAREAVVRGAESARALVSYARPTRGAAPVPVDLGVLLRDAKVLLSGALPRNVRLVLEVEPGLPAVPGHASQLEQVVVNLAMNARDAMPRGGTLLIRAAIDDAAWLRLEVRDEGLGMTPEVIARVFEPWFTTKSEGHGSGLGLPMVQRIVRDHGGSVSLESAVGQGTRITIRLPAAPPPVARGGGA